MKLSVEMSTPGLADKSLSECQSIAVGHLQAWTLQVSEAPVSLSPSPGVVVLIPADRLFEVTIGNHQHTIHPGSALLLDGNGGGSLSMPQSNELENGALHVVEVNALVNDGLTLKDLAELPRRLDSGQTAEVRRIFNGLTGEEGRGQTRPRVADIKGFLLAGDLVTALISLSGSNVSEVTVDPRLASFKRFCLTQLTSNLSTAEMAAAVHMSRSGFNKWIKPLLGMSPGLYLRRLRLEKSQELLGNTTNTIDTIAEQTGFTSRFHLSREFKKQFGISPALYRNERARSVEDRNYEKAEGLFAERDFTQALRAFDKALSTSLPQTIRERCLVAKGHCLYSMGRMDEAMQAWDTLPAGVYQSHSAKPSCEYLFHQGRHSELLSLLERILASGEGREQAIALWVDCVTRLYERRYVPALPQYLALREAFFPDDQQSSLIAAQVLLRTGEYLKTLETCHSLSRECTTALYYAGEYDKALTQFNDGISPGWLSTIRLCAGRYQEVLDLHPECSRSCARALVQLGREEEAVQIYPDHAQEAQMRMGQYDYILKHRDPGTTDWICAAHALGKLAPLLKKQPRLQKHLTQLLLDPGALLEENGLSTTEWYTPALLLNTLALLGGGDGSGAREALKQVLHPPLPGTGRIDENDSELFLLSPVISQLLGDPAPLAHDFALIFKHYRYLFQQSIWHDVSFLLGKISLKVFRSQPRQIDMPERATFIKALKLDLEGKSSEAQQQYRDYLDMTIPYPIARHQRARFADWRLNS